MAAGNRSYLVVVDSRAPGARQAAERAVFAALEHFGVAFEVLECADYMELPRGYLAPRAGYVLAHAGAGAGLNATAAAAIAAAVADGAGLVSFDREIARWPAALGQVAAAARPGPDVQVGALHLPGAAHYVQRGHDAEEEIALLRPVGATRFDGCDSGEFVGLAATENGDNVVCCLVFGSGRVVLFGTGCELYAEDVYGHVRGIDGLMWRALVWAALKPFPMRCIPPYVSARIDDCNGTYSGFAYVDAFNRYGIKPNLGLFIDELGPTDWAAAERLFQAGAADFSMHAFRDDFYKARPDYRPYALSADKPDLSRGGQVTKYEGLSLDHETGRDLDAATVRANFRRVDRAFARARIRQSRVLNAHFGEIGWRAVPYFLERGIDLPCNNSVIGQLYGNQPVWRPRPYGVRGQNGRHGLVIDRCPQHSALTFVGSGVSHLGGTHMRTDILHGHVPFLGESDAARVEAAVARGIANVHVGLDSLAFGKIMTHEERIDVISLEVWERIVAGIVRGLAGLDVEFVGREHISCVCKRLLESRLVFAEFADNEVHCELCGCTDGVSPLTVWTNERGGCVRRTADVPAFAGFTELRV